MKFISRTTLTCLVATIACAPPQPPAAPSPAPSATPVVAAAPMPERVDSPATNPITANIEARSGSHASGLVTLSQGKGSVHVVVTVKGIAPGSHGLHFHENGDCSAADAMSAKGHFNPANHAHGLPMAGARHLGDLGNIEVAADGQGRLEFELADASLTTGAANSLHGTAVILHEKADDGSQPAGNAGARIGCAVIP
jgi:superoxide dismutase, Cu-Zn family